MLYKLSKSSEHIVLDYKATIISRHKLLKL